MNHNVVDLQVNGCFGVDFNADDLTEQDLAAACEKLRGEGTDGVLATVITADLGKMIQRITRLREIRERNPLVKEVVWGLHIEGPFISGRPGFVGAHPVEFVRPADLDMMRSILDAAEGSVRIVTLAPEQDPGFRLIQFLADQNIVVSAGHCDPTRQQLEKAIDAGLSMFTHLGNGCPRQLDRHDNIIERVLSLSDRLWCSLIADGMHVPFFVLKNWLRCMGSERAIVVSDAIAAAGMGAGTYALGGRGVVVSESGATELQHQHGYFAGATKTLPHAARNLREQLDLTERDVHLLTSRNPRQLLGLA